MDYLPLLTTQHLFLSRQFPFKQVFSLQQGAEQCAARIDSTDNILLLFWLHIQTLGRQANA